MRIDVDVNGDERELRSLYDWLRRDPATRRGARVELVQPVPAPGHMGAVAEVLQLITDNAWSAASFALALSTWRQTRPQARRIVVRRGDLSVSIENGDEEELRRLITALERPDAGPEPEPEPGADPESGGGEGR
ncbi:hypothetical protein ABVG11_14775 [Streptomyces sp. HD1123-B1]|uniref:effector-associated constant component EACC1 n=1 Tax=Streptomyces huangiella TaxID=3228804 RepID=UPI003D7EC335